MPLLEACRKSRLAIRLVLPLAKSFFTELDPPFQAMFEKEKSLGGLARGDSCLASTTTMVSDGVCMGVALRASVAVKPVLGGGLNPSMVPEQAQVRDKPLVNEPLNLALGHT